MLEVKKVTKYFGGLKAVNDCSFEVGEEGITGLIGPNGAGKTTMFNIITGFLKPDGGEVIYKGERIDGKPPHEIAVKGIIRTFQISRGLESLTVEENLMVAPKNQKGEQIWKAILNTKDVREQEEMIREKCNKLLKEMRLYEFRNEFARNLSGGHLKILELARALMADPEIILLDEPVSGANPLMEDVIHDHLVNLNKQEVKLFLIEHNISFVTRTCHKIIVMSEGQIIAEGGPDDIRSNERVIKAYLGRGVEI